MLFKKIKLIIMALLKINNFWDYILDYLGLKKGYIIYKIKDKKIKTRANTIDKRIITELVLDNKYFPGWLKLKKNALIIDLGAHIGIFSILASGYDKKIYSIEPLKENFEMILEQIKLNKYKILPFKLVIANKKGKIKLYQGTHFARPSIVRKEKTDYEIVESITLKEFFEINKIKKCDLLKIDVEGAEYQILYSTPDYIFKKIDKIVMEVHKIEGETKDKLIEFLKNKNFKINYNKKEGFLWAVRPNEHFF